MSAVPEEPGRAAITVERGTTVTTTMDAEVEAAVMEEAGMRDEVEEAMAAEGMVDGLVATITVPSTAGLLRKAVGGVRRSVRVVSSTPMTGPRLSQKVSLILWSPECASLTTSSRRRHVCRCYSSPRRRDGRGHGRHGGHDGLWWFWNFKGEFGHA